MLKRRHALAAIGFTLLAGMAAFAIYRTTQHGIGLRDDSFTYFTSAESLSEGIGYGRQTSEGAFQPTTNFPPLYSAILAALHVIGLEIPAAARLVGGLTFAATVVLTGLAILLSTGSLFGALVGSGLVLASPGIIETQTWAQSEGPYIAISMLGLILITWSLTRPRGTSVLPVSGVILASALLTRYIGITLVVAATVAVLFNRQDTLRHRVRRSTLLAIGAVLPLILFLLRSVSESSNLTNRPTPFFHPFAANDMSLLDTALLHVLLPSAKATLLPSGTITLSVIALFFVMATLAHHLPGQHRGQGGVNIEPAQLLRVAGLYGGVYLLFLLFAKSFLDRLIPFDSRLVAPLTPVVVILLVVTLETGLAHSNGHIRFAGSLLLALWLCLVLQGGTARYQALTEEGLGFSSNAWKASPALDYVRGLPADALIYTNNVPAVYFLGRHRASFIPAKFDPASLTERSDYTSQLTSMRSRLEQQGGFLAIIGSNPQQRLPGPQFDDLTRHMTLVAQFGDGLIYAYP